MNTQEDAGITVRPFPIPVRAYEDLAADGPCPKARLEQARERSSWPYYLAASAVREWRREAYEAQQARQSARNPFNWLAAAGQQLYAKAEQKLAERHRNALQPHLPHAAIMARLGLPEAAQLPTCPHEVSSKRPLWQVATTIMAIGSLSFTPVRSDVMPLTREQQIELIMAGEICHTGPTAPGTPPKAPCCAPKTVLVARREKKDALAAAMGN